jgi:hypothetical protein
MKTNPPQPESQVPQELINMLQQGLIEVINQVDLEYDLAELITQIVITPTASGKFQLVINTT